jgi:hypothetical protein
MRRRIRFIIARLTSAQAGQALIIVLIFLLLGSLTLIPTLAHISTSLKTNQMYQKKTDELYTADSGIEDGLWRIKYDFMGIDYDPYDFETSWPYQTQDLNGMTANFTVKNVWFPSNVTLDSLGLTSEDAKNIIESGKLVVAGTSGLTPGKPYHIKIDFTPDEGDNLTVESLGVWLPQGFEYIADNCSLLDGGASEPYYPDHIDVSPAPGGETVVWSYDAPYPLFADFPGVDPEVTPMTLDFAFGYTHLAAHPTWLPQAVAWITTDMDIGSLGYANPDDVPVSWDIDSRFYKIVSNAGDTGVEAYSSKSELRQMGDAMSGDYVAVGNSLLEDTNHDNLRDTWVNPSQFNLQSVPADADVAAAYLYWSGWRNDDAKVDLFNDDCSNFNNWNDVGQIRLPTTDGDHSGTWSPYPSSPATLWDKVDETSPDNNNYMTSPTSSGGGYQLFSFTPFSVPAGTSILYLRIYIEARDNASGTNDIRGALKINGGSNPYYYPSGNNPGSWSDYSYTFTTNPKTGAAWTVDDINGIGANALQQFGVYSSDLNPAIRVSMVYAEVSYSLWNLSSDQFRGTGSGSGTVGQRTLTLKNSLDLHSYTPTTVVVYWNQDVHGGLESNDALYFAFSRDGGSTWSDDIEALHDDNPSPDDPFWYPVPEEYLTSNFKMRFYFNFDNDSEYVNLDNIEVIYMPPDTSITFKIGSDQVYFDGSEPAIGPNPLVAGRSYAMFDSMWGVPEGYSYACVRDVTALVRKYPENPGEEHHTGNALYTVGNVAADTLKNPPNPTISNFAFAGWSLVVVYASPETAGHYIYIRDDNFAFHPGTGGNLDFDDDPSYPGGVITNFIVPNPITDKDGNILEDVAAKLTCFVVEGDNFGTSSIQITGEQSDLSMDLWNTYSPSPDVFNGSSYDPNISEGVDIDSFEVMWDDGILTPKDNILYVDLYSYNDAWNLVYFIISIRSETVTSGTSHYVIRG